MKRFIKKTGIINIKTALNPKKAIEIIEATASKAIMSYKNA